MVVLGEVFPNFDAVTNEGPIKFHEYIENSWCILFSHPFDFTPVCTTELARAAQLAPEFTKRGVKMIALSCNEAETHNSWIKDIQAYGKLEGAFPYPIIDDTSRSLSTLLGMLDPDELDKTGLPLSARAVFFIGPDKKLKYSILYPATTGRNFDEILRAIDSVQLCVKYKVATPVDWKQGGSCMIQPSVSNDDAKTLFPKGFETAELPSQKSYIRLTAQPDS